MSARPVPGTLLTGPTVIVAAVLAGCAGTPTDPAAFHVVTGHEMSAFVTHEVCMRLARGERLEYVFESTEPVHFDLHYREGGATVQPITKDHVREATGLYAVPQAQPLCLGWEAGPAGARLDYRYRIRPPP